MVFWRGGGPLLRGNTTREIFVRFVALLLLLVAVGWLFWKNNEYALDRIERRGTVVDDLDLLSKDQKQTIRDFAKHLKDNFGIGFRLLVSHEELTYDKQDAKTIFVGIDPDKPEAVVHLPPLLRQAVGADTGDEMRELIQFGLEKGRWQQALLESLAFLWNRMLASMDDEQ